MSLSSDGTVMTMPVQPAYQGSNNGMWGGDWSSWIILFLIFGLFGGWGNGFGGFGGGQTSGVGSEVQRGFDHSAGIKGKLVPLELPALLAVVPRPLARGLVVAHQMAHRQRERLARRYMIDKWAQADIAAELGWERSTISRHISYIFDEVGRAAARITQIERK